MKHNRTLTVKQIISRFNPRAYFLLYIFFFCRPADFPSTGWPRLSSHIALKTSVQHKTEIKSRYGKKNPESEMKAEISSGFMLVMIRLTKSQNRGSISTRLKTQLSLSLNRLLIMSNSSLIWRLESFLKKFGRHLNTVTCSEPGTWRTADYGTRNLGKCPALKPLKVAA